MSENESQIETPENDDVVGVAMKASLLILLLIAMVGGGWLLFSRDSEPPPPPPEEETELATERDLPDLVIPDLPFEDITQAAGIDFIHENGAGSGDDAEKLLPETMSGGGTFFDFDGDGDQDIFCVNSNVWPWAKEQPETPPTMALYENDGTGSFSNVTAGSGLDVTFYGNGVGCGDYDNDGLVDLYVTAVGRNHLFHNLGKGKFEDVTEVAGVSGGDDEWGTSCGWFDFDRDGDLDLMVCNYVKWSRKDDLSMEFTLDGTLRAYGRPADFRGTFPTLYRNDGGGKFKDVSEAAGIQIKNPYTGEPMAKSLGLTFCDVNADHWMDVVIANDTVQNILLINQQNGTFQENGAISGIAFDNAGKARGAMGIDTAYFRNSDAVGISIGNFANEMTALYVCQTPGMSPPIFRDEAVSNGLGPVTRVELTFGVFFTDIDLDSRKDIFACNGHLEEDIQIVQESQHYEQPPQILWNCGHEYDNEFMVVPDEKTTESFTRPLVGRGASRADIDGDGDTDLLLFESGGRPRLLRNDQKTGHHWIRLKLVGTSSNKDAIGTVVRITLPDDTVLTETVMPTCSYQSQRELPVTFGLGKFQDIKSGEVTWPDGKVTPVEFDRVDDEIDVIEP